VLVFLMGVSYEVHVHDDTHTKSHDDRFWLSMNFKGITSTT
jgi:hypothetical protein